MASRFSCSLRKKNLNSCIIAKGWLASVNLVLCLFGTIPIHTVVEHVPALHQPMHLNE